MNPRIRTNQSARRLSAAAAREGVASRSSRPIRAAARLPRVAALGGLALLLAFLLAGAWSSFAPAPLTAQEKPAPTKTKKPGEAAKPGENSKPGETAKPEKTAKPGDAEKPARQGRRPFENVRKAPEFPKDVEWLNSAGPLRVQDLRGKFVLLDFWTYCCINCMHVLPELKKLEKAYPNELVVIGVHSAKFEGEKDTKNIENAILRHEIEHPVINDAEHKVWDAFGAQSWPTISLIDPEGNEVGQHSGEFKFELIDEVLKKALPYYRENKLMDESPLKFDLLSERQKKSALRYPGKLLADEKSKRLFIADSNHNRIVVTSLEGEFQLAIGSGEEGDADGDFATARFNHPQGMALQGDILYVADTENHRLRKVDLAKRTVTQLAGDGVQGSGWPGLELVRQTGELPKQWGGVPAKVSLNSPWDLWIHDQQLYIAMAGPHQIWKMPLDESFIGPYSGNGREDIVDGELFPDKPYQLGAASFAQPSGLTSDGTWLYVADSEGSSVRAVPFDPKEEVRTVVGTAHLPYGRLFTFGDKDGAAERARLQHCLAVAYHDGFIYVADTYNHKIKKVDAKDGTVTTLAGAGGRGSADQPAQFNEPAGLSLAGGKLFVADTNNHLIRTVELATGKTQTITLQGVEPPKPVTAVRRPTFAGAKQEAVAPQSLKSQDGQVQLKVKLVPPAGWKINPLAKMNYWVEAQGDEGPVVREGLGKRELAMPVAEFTVPLKVAGNGADKVTISLAYYYCQEGAEGLCKSGAVVFTVPLKIGPDGTATAELTHKIAK